MNNRDVPTLSRARSGLLLLVGLLVAAGLILPCPSVADATVDEAIAYALGQARRAYPSEPRPADGFARAAAYYTGRRLSEKKADPAVISRAIQQAIDAANAEVPGGLDYGAATHMGLRGMLAGVDVRRSPAGADEAARRAAFVEAFFEEYVPFARAELGETNAVFGGIEDLAFAIAARRLDRDPGKLKQAIEQALPRYEASLTSAEYACVQAGLSRLGGGDAGAQVRAAYEAALRKGLSAERAREIAAIAAGEATVRSGVDPRLAGLQAAELARKYTDDADLIRRAAETATLNAGGSLDDLRDVNERIAVQIEGVVIPPIPDSNRDLVAIQQAVTLLRARVERAATFQRPYMDAYLAADILTLLKRLDARLGFPNRNPDGYYAVLEGYNGVYQAFLEQLHAENRKTDARLNDVQWVVDYQTALIQFNSMLMAAADLVDFITNGLPKITDLLERPEASPVTLVDNLEVAWTLLSAVVTLDKIFDQLSGKLPFLERYKETQIVPEALEQGRFIAAHFRYIYKSWKAIQAGAKAGLEALADMQRTPVRSREAFAALAESRLGRIRQGLGGVKGLFTSANFLKLVNSLLKMVAQASLDRNTERLRELRKVYKAEVEQIDTQLAARASTLQRMEQVRQTAPGLRSVIDDFAPLFQKACGYPHPAQAFRLPEVEKDPEGKPRWGDALKRHNAALVEEGPLLFSLVQRLEISQFPPEAADDLFIAAASDFETGTDGWQVVGNGEPAPVQPEHRRHSGISENTRYLASEERTSLAQGGGAMDLVVVFDTTGSMRSAIDSVRSSAKRIIETVRGRIRDFRLGLVEFRDLTEDGPNAIKTTPLSSDLATQFRVMDGWSAGGGGSDISESQFEAVEAALNRLQWRTENADGVTVSRVVMVITDAPAKDDAAGTKLKGTIAAARAVQTRVYSLLTGERANHAQAERLAQGTDGRVLSASDAAKLADSLLEALELAAEETAPRYWQAPAKFLGDRSASYGSPLAFWTYQRERDPHFWADDVILTGGGKTLVLRLYTLPQKDWRKVEVRLDESEPWYVQEPRKLATGEEIRAVLKDLRRLAIRADYRLGADLVGLDNVKLFALPSEKELERARVLVENLRIWRRDVMIKQRSLDHLYGTDERLVTRYRRAKLPAPEDFARMDYPAISAALFGEDGNDGLYHVYTTRLVRSLDESIASATRQREVARIARDNTRVVEAYRVWRARSEALNDTIEKLLENVTLHRLYAFLELRATDPAKKSEYGKKLRDLEAERRQIDQRLAAIDREWRFHPLR